MSCPATNIDGRIGARVHALRTERGLTLDGLARLADVSRAMLSRIERGESSPTAQLLAKICGGLGITPSVLFAQTEAPPSPLSRRRDQPVWRDPATRYLRRNVSPPGTGSPVDIVEVEFPPGYRHQTGWLDPGLPATFSLVDRGLADVAEIFPGRYIHIGGDEPVGMPHDRYVSYVRHD